MRVQVSAVVMVSGLVFGGVAPVSTSIAAPAADPFELLNEIPALPANVASAGAATQIGAGGTHGLLTAPAHDALANRITTALRPTAAASAGGIDFARASSDPAYAAQVQARLQNMNTADKMAMANQMMAAQRAAAGDPQSAAQIVAFLGSQRAADSAAQQKMRALLEGALVTSGAKHRAVDGALNAAAKACPQDKTGWPLQSCTTALGLKSLAQHRAVEDAALGGESQALAQAHAVALTEINKGRELLNHAVGTTATSLLAWSLAYVLILDDYAKAMTLRAGFWAHADSSKYTGQVSIYIKAPGGDIVWPLKDQGFGEQVVVGL